MIPIKLNSKAIGAIRDLAKKELNRAELKQFLFVAGANSDRISAIDVVGETKSPAYKSMTTIMNDGFDTLPQDFSKEEADGIRIELLRLIFSRKQVSEKDRADIAKAFSTCDVALDEILEPNATLNIVQTSMECSESAALKEAHDLLKEALLRITTDPRGAITAAVTAAVSVCREALSRLGIPEPSKRQLPKYLVELRRNTNIEELAQVPNVEGRVIKALSSLAENSYQAAHETGDRHAHGDSAGPPTPLIVDLLVTSACAISVVLAGALRRDELKLKSRSGADIQ